MGFQWNWNENLAKIPRETYFIEIVKTFSQSNDQKWNIMTITSKKLKEIDPENYSVSIRELEDISCAYTRQFFLTDSKIKLNAEEEKGC